MGFSEYLKALEAETERLIRANDARNNEATRIEPLLAKVDEDYDADFEIIKKAYLEECALLAKKRDDKKKEISKKLDEMISLCDNSRISIENTKTSILNEFQIDNELMCKLLEKQTGLEWRVFMIKGDMSDSMWGGCLHRYGFGLVDETHPYFSEGSVYLFPDDVIERSPHLILGMDCGTSDKRKAEIYRHNRPKYNWMKKYLLQKGKLHDNVRYFGFDHSFTPEPELNILVDAVDTYLENPLILDSMSPREDFKESKGNSETFNKK